jgi:type VI secretion system protein ImpA
MASESEWQQVLETAENIMAQACGRAWLDLQRYAVRACEQLGYDAVASAIKSELKALLSDFPDLVNATLMDDTATANSETKAWIAEFASAAPAQHHAPVPSMQDDTPEEEKLGESVPDTYTLALQAARSGRPQEAIELLTGEISRQNSGRGRFQRKLQLAQLCIQMGYEPIAKSILEELARTVDKHQLEEWESADIVAHAFSMLYDCMQKLDGDPVERQKLYERICRLDPMQAFAHAR